MEKFVDMSLPKWTMKQMLKRIPNFMGISLHYLFYVPTVD
jgi:hypothetical protein